MIQEARGIFMLRAFFQKLSLLQNEDKMKFFNIGIVSAFSALLLGCSDEAKTRTVIVYFSQTGTTKIVASEIRKNTGADMAELLLKNPYPSTYDSTIQRVKREREAKRWPEIFQAKMNLAKYDTVFLGYPIMFGTFAPPIYTFLDSNDLKGKVVVPFCTYGSGGVKNSAKELKSLVPGMKIVRPYGIAHKRISKAPEEVRRFLQTLSAKEDEEMVGAYSEMRLLTSEDSTVFAEATADYAYLHLVPKSVKSQVVAGTNYVFLCEMKGPDGILAEARVLIFEPLPGHGASEMIRVDR